MPTKAAASPVKPGTDKDNFLAACIRHAVEKPKVNIKTLATELGMSEGGARNKFGAIMKQLAEAGAIWAKPAMNDEDKDEDAVQPKSTPKRKATSKKMATKANGDNDEDNHGGNASASEDEDEPKTPKKKAKTTPKKVKKGKQDMTKSKATEVDEDDTDVIMKHEANAEEEMDELRIDDLKEEEDN